MVHSTHGELPLRNQQDLVICRQAVRQIAERAGFKVLGQTMLVTATSELARNAIIHGGGGEALWEIVLRAGSIGIKLTFRDSGPGISDMQLAMTHGWTSGGGLGMGLTGAKRLVHEFSISSAAGQGTLVSILRWR
jgi:serine/threonine-protein kinase RsbT